MLINMIILQEIHIILILNTGINYLRLVDDVKVINNIICYPRTNIP